MVTSTRDSIEGTIPASEQLLAWETGELPPPPILAGMGWAALLGPGLLLAGAAVGSGEWLFGPAVSAQYGAVLLWLATISIVCQVFCNLQMMRYAVYCGEPIVVGYFRTWPGPWFWTPVYILLDFSMIWPMNAANGAVPLAAAFLGHLPGDASVDLVGWQMAERSLVQVLGYVIFIAAFIPLIFGGSIYRTLEKAMALKMVLVFGYLVVICGLLVSARHAREVFVGFTQFGTVPLRADSVIAGRHFVISERVDQVQFSVRGSFDGDRINIVGFTVRDGKKKTDYQSEEKVPEELRQLRKALAERARSRSTPDGFYIETDIQRSTLTLRGRIGSGGLWELDEANLETAGERKTFHNFDEMPAELATRCRALLANEGQENVNIVSYFWQHGKLPPLDWALLAAFAAIAGSGGMTNTLFSNYARDKGWGMGAHVGAIPSAFGGTTVSLSHVGKVFPLDTQNLTFWRGWMRWIFRDQVSVWMLCSFLGMALPCMLSLEFMRHAPVAGDRVPAMLADGIAHRYPDLRSLCWLSTLFIGFIVIAPGQIIASDQIARRWTDIVWTVNQRTRSWHGSQVKYVYYGILGVFAIWGIAALALFDPLQIAKINGVLGNVALAFTALHALHVNRTLLPRELRPGAISQAGILCCGVFFLLISGIVFWNP